MATHTLDAQDTAANLAAAARIIADGIADGYIARTSTTRDALLTVRGIVDALDAGDDLVFETEEEE